jgi:hypothetical protein
MNQVDIRTRERPIEAKAMALLSVDAQSTLSGVPTRTDGQAAVPSPEEDSALALAAAYLVRAADVSCTTEPWPAEDPRGVFWSYRAPVRSSQVFFRFQHLKESGSARISWERLKQLGPRRGISPYDVIFAIDMKHDVDEIRRRLLKVSERSVVYHALRHGGLIWAAKLMLRTIGADQPERTDALEAAWGFAFVSCKYALGESERHLLQHENFFDRERVADLRALLAIECVDERYRREAFHSLRRRRNQRRRCFYCRNKADLHAPEVFNDWTLVCRFCLIAGKYLEPWRRQRPRAQRVRPAEQASTFDREATAPPPAAGGAAAR